MTRKTFALLIATLLLFSLWSSCFSESPGALTLDEYLRQVVANNAEIKSTDLTRKALGEKVRELDLVYSPLFSAGYTYAEDKGGVGFGSILPAKEIRSNSWNVGVSKKFSTGSALSLGYTSSGAIFDLLFPAQIIDSQTLSSFTGYEIKPFARIEQSLLRDFKSGLTRSGINKTRASTLAAQYMQLFKRQQTLLKARLSYWTLSLTREVVASRKASLERARTLLKWNEKRVDLDLADKGDLYQAQAAEKLRQLNLEQALQDEKKASQDFNELRNLSSGTVSDELERISDKESEDNAAENLKRTGERADVLSARAQYESSRFAEKETYYRSLPEVSLTGSVSLHGLGLAYSDAWSQVVNAEKPAYAVGISLLVPLDYKTLMKVKEGYALDHRASRASLDKAELSAKDDWNQLMHNWENVKRRLQLAAEIKEIQSKRVANEQVRFQRGKTTTFLLLNAENDLDDAIINVYRLTLEKLNLSFQAALYNTQPIAPSAGGTSE